MGRKSRTRNARRNQRVCRTDSSDHPKDESSSSREIRRLEAELCCLTDGRCELLGHPGADEQVREDHLRDILDFEDVGKGTSMFLGLQRHGLDLPAPDELGESESAEKIREILEALSQVGVFLIGFEKLTARQFYSKLWHQTLWEGCYPERRRVPGLTLIDVSCSMSRPHLKGLLRELERANRVN